MNTNDYVITDARKQVWLIAIVCTVALMITFDYSSLNISLSSIADYFHIKIDAVAWLPTAYLLIITSCLLGFGKLGDIIGCKKVFIAGLSVFAVGAFLCAISPNFHVLLAARAFQSFGQAMYSPFEIAIITTFLPANIRGRALGLYATFQGVGMAAGSPLGGLINCNFSWRGNFLVAIPLALLIIAMSIKILPEKQSKTSDIRFDLFGAVLLFLFLANFIYAINSGTKAGWASPLIIRCFIFALTTFVIFILQEKRAPNPLLDLSLFKNMDFTFAAIAAFLGMGLSLGTTFLFPFYFQMVRHLEITKAGLLLIAPSLVMMLVAPIAGNLSDRIGSSRLCVFGMSLVTLAFTMFYFLTPESHILYIVASLSCFGMGLGLFLAPNNRLVMAHAPADKQGVASGVYKISLNAGSSVGIALFILVVSQVVLFDITRLNIVLSEVRQHPDIIMAGFHSAFMFGIFVSIVSIVMSFLARDKK